MIESESYTNSLLKGSKKAGSEEKSLKNKLKAFQENLYKR